MPHPTDNLEPTDEARLHLVFLIATLVSLTKTVLTLAALLEKNPPTKLTPSERHTWKQQAAKMIRVHQEGGDLLAALAAHYEKQLPIHKGDPDATSDN